LGLFTILWVTFLGNSEPHVPEPFLSSNIDVFIVFLKFLPLIFGQQIFKIQFWSRVSYLLASLTILGVMFLGNSEPSNKTNFF